LTLSRGRLYLDSNAKQKVSTGRELVHADATVADVNFRLTLYRFKFIVILEPNE
jgi:hypothetical protein